MVLQMQLPKKIVKEIYRTSANIQNTKNVNKAIRKMTYNVISCRTD